MTAGQKTAAWNWSKCSRTNTFPKFHELERKSHEKISSGSLECGSLLRFDNGTGARQVSICQHENCTRLQRQRIGSSGTREEASGASTAGRTEPVRLYRHCENPWESRAGKQLHHSESVISRGDQQGCSALLGCGSRGNRGELCFLGRRIIQRGSARKRWPLAMVSCEPPISDRLHPQRLPVRRKGRRREEGARIRGNRPRWQFAAV